MIKMIDRDENYDFDEMIEAIDELLDKYKYKS